MLVKAMIIRKRTKKGWRTVVRRAMTERMTSYQKVGQIPGPVSRPRLTLVLVELNDSEIYDQEDKVDDPEESNNEEDEILS